MKKKTPTERKYFDSLDNAVEEKMQQFSEMARDFCEWNNVKFLQVSFSVDNGTQSACVLLNGNTRTYCKIADELVCYET